MTNSAAGDPLPAGVVEIPAPEPLEISGVAAVREGYAVVGNEDNDHGRIWPGGARFGINPAVKGPESIDVEVSPDGKELWLVLGEDKRRLADLSGGRYKLPKKFKEVCGRGAEGLALRWHHGTWQAAVLWEGGFYDPDKKGKKCKKASYHRPKVAILRWQPGRGSKRIDRQFKLKMSKLHERANDNEKFRAPDLVWNGNRLLVLLNSADTEGAVSSHTWLQNFDLDGNPAGDPVKLEELWQVEVRSEDGRKTVFDYRGDKNWEALDWTLDRHHLVMGYDTRKNDHSLVIFPYP